MYILMNSFDFITPLVNYCYWVNDYELKGANIAPLTKHNPLETINNFFQL